MARADHSPKPRRLPDLVQIQLGHCRSLRLGQLVAERLCLLLTTMVSHALTSGPLSVAADVCTLWLSIYI